MAEVEIYKAVKGKKLEKFLATMPGVPKALDANAREVRDRATAIKAGHIYERYSYIQKRIEKGKGGDRYVIFVDPKAGTNNVAALSIEFGTKRSRGIRALLGAIGR